MTIPNEFNVNTPNKLTARQLDIILNEKDDIPVHITPEGKVVRCSIKEPHFTKDCSEKQGCVSTIEFPLGQDERAVGMAINQLLDEGWKFFGLSKTHISVSRRWEV